MIKEYTTVEQIAEAITALINEGEISPKAARMLLGLGIDLSNTKDLKLLVKETDEPNPRIQPIERT